MKVSTVRITAAGVLVALGRCTACFAIPPDPGLLSLVPPGSKIVAGAVAPLKDLHRGNFLVFTRANVLDIEDFISLARADGSLEIRQVILAASVGPDGVSAEHSLLVTGHFDTKRIYRSASATSTAWNYHEVGLIVVHPFERERATLRDDRLLAIINSRLAIFGTVLSVEEEIDRYLNSTQADATIMQSLSQLQNQYETWCLVSSLSFSGDILRVLTNLDPAFSQIDETSDAFLFGIRYGRKIEIEYVMNPRPVPQAVPVSSSPTEGMFGPADGGLSLASHSRMPSGTRGLVRISKARYEKWLAGLTQHQF